MGLVNRVVDDGAALDAAVELATAIASNGPLAVAATKRIVQEAPAWSPGRSLGPPAGGHRARLHLRGRPRGRRGVRREARPGVEGPLTRAQPDRSGLPHCPGTTRLPRAFHPP